MRDYVVSTESSGDLSRKYIAAHDIRVIPMHYSIAGEEYGAEKELPPEEFYGKMREGDVGKTVACNPTEIEAVFRPILEEGKDILHIGFDASMSSTVETEKMVAAQLSEEYPEARILVLDSYSASYGEGILAARAQQMKEGGASFDETATEIRRLVPHMSVVSTVDDLNYLYRGGRLSRSSALIGSVVQVKPLLFLDEKGAITVRARIRGRKNSMKALVDTMEETIGDWRDRQLRVGIVHADCFDDADQVKKMVEERFGYTDVFIAPLGPTLGAHSGPGTLGLIFLAETR